VQPCLFAGSSGVNWIKINLCCARPNNCGLFSDKQNAMASIKLNDLESNIFEQRLK